MKIVNARECALHFLDAVNTQLVKQIDAAYSWFNSDNDVMLQPFQYGAGWIENEPYCDMKFEYEYFKGSLIQLCNMIEMICGQEFENEFVTELTAEMIAQVEDRIAKRGVAA